MTPNEQQALLEWFAAGDTGTSSKTLANEFAGLPQDRTWGVSHPSDGGDLGRCVRLIDKIPGVRSAVDALAAKDKYWKALAPEWDRLVGIYRDEAASRRLERTYDAMRAVLDPIQRADPNVIVLGKGASVRFGR